MDLNHRPLGYEPYAILSLFCILFLFSFSCSYVPACFSLMPCFTPVPDYLLAKCKQKRRSPFTSVSYIPVTAKNPRFRFEGITPRERRGWRFLTNPLAVQVLAPNVVAMEKGTRLYCHRKGNCLAGICKTPSKYPNQVRRIPSKEWPEASFFLHRASRICSHSSGVTLSSSSGVSFRTASASMANTPSFFVPNYTPLAFFGLLFPFAHRA